MMAAFTGIDVESFLLSGTPRVSKEVVVNFSFSFNRKICKDLDASIEEQWKVCTSKNLKMYNGSKFRFAGARALPDRVELDIGITDYKHLIGTNCSPIGMELERLGLLHCGDRQAHFADPLGVGSLLLTLDNKFLFIKRALWTGEDAGKIDRPGGHPEPAQAAQKSNLSDETDLHLLSAEAVVVEIFGSVLCEIRDEINIPVEELSEPLLLGAVRSKERFGRPSLEFLVRCNLTSLEAESYYRHGTQPEADESVDILFIPEGDLLDHRLVELGLWDKLTDASRGAVYLYSALRCG